MTNREAINIITAKMCLHQAVFGHPIDEPLKTAYETAIAAMKQQEKDRWIPVTERLPENKKKVLVSYDTEDGKKVDISMFDKYGCLLGPVSAWRPLPEPYTEEES